MTIDLSTFLSQLVSNPALLITFALTLGRHPGKRLDGCAQRNCHLRIYPGHQATVSDPDGRCVQLF